MNRPFTVGDNAEPMSAKELAERREYIASLGPRLYYRQDRDLARLLVTVAELRDALTLYAVFRGGDDDGGESDECALCEARWQAEGEAKHNEGCVLA